MALGLRFLNSASTEFFQSFHDNSFGVESFSLMTSKIISLRSLLNIDVCMLIITCVCFVIFRLMFPAFCDIYFVLVN